MNACRPCMSQMNHRHLYSSTVSLVTCIRNRTTCKSTLQSTTLQFAVSNGIKAVHIQHKQCLSVLNNSCTAWHMKTGVTVTHNRYQTFYKITQWNTWWDLQYDFTTNLVLSLKMTEFEKWPTIDEVMGNSIMAPSGHKMTNGSHFFIIMQSYVLQSI